MEYDDRTKSCIEDDYYHPTWLDIPRVFQDCRTTEVEAFNDFLTQHLHPCVESWDCDEDGWAFNFDFGTIRADNDAYEPLSVRASSNVMPRKYLDGMRIELRSFLREPEHVDWRPKDHAVLLLQLVEEAVAWNLMWKLGERVKTQYSVKVRFNVPHHDYDHGERLRRNAGEQCGYRAGPNQDYQRVMQNPHGVNLRSVEDTAIHLLGKSIESICSNVASEYRILHVEPVFRDDLVSRFLKRQEEILDHLRGMPYRALRESVSSTVIRPHSVEDSKEGLAQQLAMPTVTFHGAPRQVISSIVRYGFIVPGSEIGKSGATLAIRCGSTYGTGIYSSPDATFASSYLDYQHGKVSLTQPSEVPGMRLVICATLKGRPMQVCNHDARGRKGVLHPAAHSHVSSDGYQVIVFDSAQIVPCYVLHLDYGSESAKEQHRILATDPAEYFKRRARKRKPDKEWEEWFSSCPGDDERKKQALKAAAAKWLPYGYGPAKGTNFVVEDMAEVSDDEELHGEFQHQRIEQEFEIQEGGSAQRTCWFDEYQTVRKSDSELDFSRTLL